MRVAISPPLLPTCGSLVGWIDTVIQAHAYNSHPSLVDRLYQSVTLAHLWNPGGIEIVKVGRSRSRHYQSIILVQRHGPAVGYCRCRNL